MATAVLSQQAGQTSGVTRTILSTTDVPDSRYIVVQVTAEVAAGATVARHTHPGIEAAYVLDGEGEVFIDGQPTQALKANASFHVPHRGPAQPAQQRLSTDATDEHVYGREGEATCLAGLSKPNARAPFGTYGHRYGPVNRSPSTRRIRYVSHRRRRCSSLSCRM